ncbi:MAG: ABC transporter permease [Anaerolineales bacterium]|nr:ABC transporter permease [Anaerolineales bacterium]MCB0019198.1 ABC transporter permease [Anaerolineales bacterium]
MAGSQPLWRRLFLGLAPFVLTLAAASVLILLVDRSPWEVFSALFQGAFGTAIKRADTAVAWVSVAIASAGLLVTFRAGQWNIGVEGQITMGAIFAFWAGRVLWEAPAGVALPAMILWGMVGGMFWAVLVAILRVYGGVHEIFGGLGLNFVSTSVMIMLISGPWRPEGTSTVSTTDLLPQTIWLPTLGDLRVSPISVVLAIVVVIAVTVSLSGTIWGLQLKAVGRNMRGAFVMGIPTNRMLFSAYIVGGLCAGLVGALLLVGVRHQLVQGISAGYGFLGILIVLLSGFNGVWIAPIALFFAALGIGGTALRLSLDLDSSLGGVLIGVIVLSYEMVQGLRQRFGARLGLGQPAGNQEG